MNEYNIEPEEWIQLFILVGILVVIYLAVNLALA